MGQEGGKRRRWEGEREIVRQRGVRLGENNVKVKLFLGNKIQLLFLQPWQQLSEKK